jgi:hypothetical protein
MPLLFIDTVPENFNRRWQADDAMAHAMGKLTEVMFTTKKTARTASPTHNSARTIDRHGGLGYL